jgi:anti-sigma factor ChrR (cupin superfamily)
MNLNDDFAARAAVHAARLDWVASPIAGVDRRMLDRIGDEAARATSIVRYAPGSRFSPHTHGGGEEFLVLDGVFQDEHGDFGPGSYIRNPPGSRHTPGSAPGCTIFVKLWQFDPDDGETVRRDANAIDWLAAPGRPGVTLRPLYRAPREDVRLERWAPGSAVALADHDGIELLVLAGGFTESGETFSAQSWLRLPPDMPLQAVAGSAGATVWIKSGHLARPPRIPDVA